MLKKCLLIVVFLCSAVAYGDVAMVTDLTGTVEATLENASWSVSLAEILSDGTHLKTGRESSLTVIHMAGNKEYRLEAEKEAVVTMEGITGENLSGKDLQMVANSFDLGGDSSNQAGAAHVDRASSSIQSSDENSVEETPSAPASRLAQEKLSEQDIADSFEKMEAKKKADNVILKEAMNKDTGPLAGAAPAKTELARQMISFALPKAVLEKFTSAGAILDIDNSEVKNFSNSEIISDWAQIDVEIATSGAEISLNIKGEKEILAVKVFCGEKISSDISLAWKLEREGYLAQAAWIWISLKDQGRLSSEKADIHLKRISETMLK